MITIVKFVTDNPSTAVLLALLTIVLFYAFGRVTGKAIAHYRNSKDQR
jgi:hypothetical protein